VSGRNSQHKVGQTNPNLDDGVMLCRCALGWSTQHPATEMQLSYTYVRPAESCSSTVSPNVKLLLLS
jgi:hypothetical protein